MREYEETRKSGTEIDTKYYFKLLSSSGNPQWRQPPSRLRQFLENTAHGSLFSFRSFLLELPY
jgi:hypothetical protein